MRGRITSRWALLACVLGAVTALSVVVALLQLQNVNNLGSASHGEERPATTGTREAETRSAGARDAEDSGESTSLLTQRMSPVEVGADSQRVDRTERERQTPPPEPEAGDTELAELEAEVREISARYPGEYGVVLWQPGTERRVAVGSGESFKAASLAKLPVMLALYREAAQGRLSLDERIEIAPSDIQSGTGELQNRPPGTTMTLRECVEYLMKESDNTAWAMLEDRLGNDRIRSEIASAGARSTNYEYAKHSTTPEDTLRMLQRISDPGYTSPRLSAEMLDYMTDTSFESWLPQGLPQEARISHKIGILGDSFGDAGIVYPPEGEGSSEPYYVVVLAKDTTEPQARAAMQEISLTAYRDLVNPEARPRSERESLQASSDQRQ